MANQPYDDMELTAEKELDALIVASQMESNFDIDKILNDKAKKRKFTKTNVKNLIKNVITNADVATMLRQTLDDNIDANCLYEPKFTRAKIREMLNTYPTSGSTNQQQSILSECTSLIEKEFPDDSEDEEYHPDKMFEEEEDEYDDDEFKLTEVNKSFDTENDQDISDSKTVVDVNVKETIGMRTRSKFSLNDTPLEIIEQAFIPPDITEDMYDSACENDEWMEFLSEFTKPLESVQNDDGEDDPEYNVLGDDDFTNVDKEEFRIDKSVKVTRKEYNDLMNELNEFTESFLEFNGVEKFETNTDTKETDNDKNTDKPKNDTQSIPTCVCIPNNYSDGKSSTNFSFQNKNSVKRTNVTISNPVFMLNYCNGKSSTNCSTNNYVEPIEVARYTTQIDKQFNVSEFNNSLLSINEHLEKRSCIHPSLPTFKENVQLGIEQHNSNEDVSVITNIVPQYVNISNQVNIMTQKQIILFKQQLTQHVQLITQNYLLCTMSKKFQVNCRKYKIMLELIKDICKDKKYAPINAHSALKFIRDWTDFKTNENDINSDYVVLPLHVKEFMLYYDKPVFIYPQLLPTRTYHHEYKNHPIGPSEEKLLVLKIDYIYKNLKESCNTRAKYRKKNLSDLMPMIIKTVHKRWFSNRSLIYLKQYITRQKNSFEMNVIKNYLTHGKIEESSYVIDIKALFKGNRLYECDVRKFPSSWKCIRNQLKLKK